MLFVKDARDFCKGKVIFVYDLFLQEEKQRITNIYAGNYAGIMSAKLHKS